MAPTTRWGGRCGARSCWHGCTPCCAGPTQAKRRSCSLFRRSRSTPSATRSARTALVFYWPQFERQVRVEGKVTKTSAEESAAYFKTRPRESQIGAWASPHRELIAEREGLEQRAHELAELYCNREVDCPAHWGGFRLTPDRIEFWKGRVGRLHDRILYELQADGGWTTKRLAP